MEFQLLLSEFAIERLLYRLGASPYADRFALKGAALFNLWPKELRRATWRTPYCVSLDPYFMPPPTRSLLQPIGRPEDRGDDPRGQAAVRAPAI
ncbi:hypothetical protein [Candidatus Methylomirabilis sp.]|uniref:Nucleotidyl transferase AbiEii/AbiGii toxin family protein n=1 Tax=Candidatus Methylomirabilis tolerans TaxID=3123416 RepID=A0AAJ1AJL9_9BACT|nr:nucleotidyl transferase AbiEii/AbiGii toxin family protein [Candidatus Methylomirabilis sp.]